MSVTTTINELRLHYPCVDGWKQFLRANPDLAPNTEFPLIHILNSNTVEDLIWALRAVPPVYSIVFARMCVMRTTHMSHLPDYWRVNWVEHYADGVKSGKEEIDFCADSSASLVAMRTGVFIDSEFIAEREAQKQMLINLLS